MRLAALYLTLATPALADSVFAPEEAEGLQAGLTTTAEDFILPGYEAWAGATADLEVDLVAYCAGSRPLEPAQADYAEAFLAWQRIAVVQMGPVTEAEGPMRVVLWPDPKGFARRAVLMAVRAEDPALTSPGGLEGRSIALTGMGALEDLVFAEDLAPGTYACDLATAIAGYQADLSGGIAADWTPGAPFRTAYDTAAEGNARYGAVDDVLRELLSGVTVHIAKLGGDKLGRGLGAGPGEARAERTEAVASSLGLPGIAAAFGGLAGLYAVPGGVFDVAAEIGNTDEHALLATTAAGVADELTAMDRTLAEIAEEDGAAAAELRSLIPLAELHDRYLTVTLPGALGLSAGFSASDGD